VIREPGATVNVFGHTALFRIRTVVAFGSVEQVSVGEGAAPLVPPHAAMSASAAPPAVRPVSEIPRSGLCVLLLRRTSARC
jgi:hypothetical protein